MSVTYTIALPDPAKARGSDPRLAFSASGAAEFAAQLQDALRTDGLFAHWCAQQDDPDDVDPLLGATDIHSSVSGQQDDLRILLQVTTALPSLVIKHRLQLLAGSNWELRDVRLK
jgi:hypothetical protein